MAICLIEPVSLKDWCTGKTHLKVSDPLYLRTDVEGRVQQKLWLPAHSNIRYNCYTCMAIGGL